MYNQALAAARSSPLVAAAAPSAAASQAEALPAEAHPGRAGFAFGEGGGRADIRPAREQLEPALARRDGDDHVPYAPDAG